jgi:arylsulfatase A-like enzyme
MPVVRFLLFGLLAFAFEAFTKRGLAEEVANIVLICADDLGWRDVATNSDGFIETPNLDYFRKQGMSFTSAYAGAANCAPSRACLLSGQYTPRHGVYAVGSTARGPEALFRLTPIRNTNELAPAVVTVAEELKNWGYATGHFGKWHLGGAARETGPADQGFDISPEDLIDPRDGSEKAAANERVDRSVATDPKDVFAITKAACQFIAANKSRPFFVFLSHHGIHSPLKARATSIARFREKASAFEKPHASALYAACVFDLDAAVGELMKTLKDEGLEENTLVIFTSDNGATPAAVNAPLRGAKGAYYEAGIRVPFFVRWPGKVPVNATCDVPIINLDLYPTFVAAAGGRPEAALDGESLLPLFQANGNLSRSSIYWHFPGYLDQPVPRGRDEVFRTRPVSVVRSGDWKLYLYHEEWLLDGGRDRLATNRAVELYNLRDDIGEQKDLAITEPKRRDELLDDLLGWLERTDAKLARLK